MRCFLAIELSSAVQQRLAQLQQRLSHLGRQVRWTRPEHIHLTLKFLGEVPDADVPDVCELARLIAAETPVMELTVAGVGCFPPHGPVRIIWQGISPEPPALLECQQRCETEFADLGFAPEQRAYHPHLTIGRVGDRADSRAIRNALERCGSDSAGTFTANQITVFQSVLGPEGPTYTALTRAPFQGAANP